MKKKGMKQSAKLILDLITTIIVTLIAGAVTVAAVISMAWFASNKEVGTNGSSVTVDAELFELKSINNTESTATRVKPLLKADDRTVKYYDGLETSASAPGIMCDIIVDATDNALDEDLQDTIRPGAFGRIQFTIVPKKDGRLFELKPKLIGITLATVDSGQIIDDINDETYGDALTVLNGHFLIFTQYDDSETGLERYNKNNRIIADGNTVIYVDNALEAGEEYTVTLYWIWIRTFNELKGLLGNEIDKPAEAHYFFYDGRGSAGYNNGDQLIADTFSDLAILFDVNTVDAIPAEDGTITIHAEAVSE